MEIADRHEELEATIRRVKLLLIKAKISKSEGAREQCLAKVCIELREFLGATDRSELALFASGLRRGRHGSPHTVALRV